MTAEEVDVEPQQKGPLGWVTKNSKAITALSAAAIPVVLAGMGWVTTKAINDQNLDKEYVNLATGILAAKHWTGSIYFLEKKETVLENITPW